VKYLLMRGQKMKKLIIIVALIFQFTASFAQVSVVSPKSIWVFSATGLPPGLTIDTSTGVISGKFDRTASRNDRGFFDVIVNFNNGNGASGQTNVRISVPNTAPIARNDQAIISDIVTSTALYVLANDSDTDRDDLSITFAKAGHGSLLISSKTDISYLPSKGFSGTDIVHYTISDGYGGTATATVRVIVPTAR
jgi:large repetitive protein